MPRSYLYGLVVVSVLAAGLFGLLGGDQDEEDSVLSIRLAEPAPSSSSQTALAEESTTTLPVANERAPKDLIAVNTSITTITTTTTTVPPTTTQAPTTTAAAEPTETQPKKSAPPVANVESGFASGYESDFAASINSYRSSKGLPELTRDGSLDGEARAWAKRMAQRGAISHSDLGRFLPPWSAAGENVGSGGSVGGLFDALVASSGHRANLLGGFTHFGVGVWVDESGTLWTAHVFTG